MALLFFGQIGIFTCFEFLTNLFIESLLKATAFCHGESQEIKKSGISPLFFCNNCKDFELIDDL